MSQRKELRVGALAPPIHEQIGCQKYESVRFQSIHDAIVTLKIYGYISDYNFHKFGKKLHQEILKEGITYV